jgi:hypothetical protein
MKRQAMIVRIMAVQWTCHISRVIIVKEMEMIPRGNHKFLLGAHILMSIPLI